MIRYPERLAHQTPAWVGHGSIFHIRMSINARESPCLTDPPIGTALLNSARFYHDGHRWNCQLFLLMPDHFHALLAFPYGQKMRDILVSRNTNYFALCLTASRG
ncbi:MAG: hypothetical protein PSV13_12720, partial [Lacunisphaera sp.]|nr:hypothetical protein [Lacunisphaera sp.]